MLTNHQCSPISDASLTETSQDVWKSHIKNYNHIPSELTHWGLVTHIFVYKLPIIGPVNGLSPGQRRAIIWTNVGTLLIWPLGKLRWNINQNSYIFIQENAFETVAYKMSAILSRPQCVKTQLFLNSRLSRPHCWVRGVGLLMIERQRRALTIVSMVRCWGW